MEAEVDEVVGPKGRHIPDHAAVRHGHDAGEVTLGGRRVPVSRPRARSADGEHEVELGTYAHFAARDRLSEVMFERMLAGVSTRRYARTGEPVGEEIDERGPSRRAGRIGAAASGDGHLRCCWVARMYGRIGAVDERSVRRPDRSSAALAIENERLQRMLRARLEEERALRRVATLVAREHAPEVVLTVVTEEVARHLAADAAMTVRYDGPGRASVVAEWSARDHTRFTVGAQLEIGPQTALARAFNTLAPARVDSYEEMPGEYAAQVRKLGMRAGAAAPILVDGQLWGAVAVGSWGDPFTEGAETRLGAFAELIAQAIANVDARIKLKESRARIVEAADEARRRIERDLHDGAQQRLVALALSLRLAATQAEPATATVIEGCIEELRGALADLRELARGLHPVVLSERGLPSALEMLATRSPVPVVLDRDLERALPRGHETALYFVAAEALTNVAKYARASIARLTLRADEEWAEVSIADDGVGGAQPEHGSGLRGLSDRVEALGGQLTVASAIDEGTTVTARIPMTKTASAAISQLAGQA